MAYTPTPKNFDALIMGYYEGGKLRREPIARPARVQLFEKTSTTKTCIGNRRTASTNSKLNARLSSQTMRKHDLPLPARLFSRDQVLSRPSPVPKEPGVYAWHFGELPPTVPVTGCLECRAARHSFSRHFNLRSTNQR